MAGEGTVAKIPKPVMRGLLHSQIKRNLIVAIGLAGFCGFMYKQLVANPRKQLYREFYRTYDAEKEFEEMRKKGLFQSC